MRANTYLVEQILKVKELERQKKELEDQIESVKNILKDEMVVRNKDELSVGGYTLRYKVIESKSFDTKAFKAEFDALYEKFCNVKESSRFTILKEGK